jgi:carotenoid 1,2-hydratase
VSEFEAPPTKALPKTLWAIPRRMRSDSEVRIQQQLEDTPFYQRAILQSELLGETVESFHETLNVPRLTSKIVQAMLPWRMPRRT